MKPLDQVWSISQAVELACILEASSPKLGNVHPGASFRDMHFGHFVAAAARVAPLFDNPGCCRVGRLVLDAVVSTRRCVECNTNLGTLLLLAPLAVGAGKLELAGIKPTMDYLRQATGQVLRELNADDSQAIYDAIRVASPGGLGHSELHDVDSQAPEDLLDAMRLVSEIDAVARQYVSDFEDIFLRFWPWLLEELRCCDDPLQAIGKVQLRWLAHEPDGLIVRKLGWDEGKRIQQSAARVYELSKSHSLDFAREYQALDHSLRDEANRRNPGTTADLIAATLFCQLVAWKD